MRSEPHYVFRGEPPRANDLRQLLLSPLLSDFGTTQRSRLAAGDWPAEGWAFFGVPIGAPNGTQTGTPIGTPSPETRRLAASARSIASRALASCCMADESGRTFAVARRTPSLARTRSCIASFQPTEWPRAPQRRAVRSLHGTASPTTPRASRGLPTQKGRERLGYGTRLGHTAVRCKLSASCVPAIGQLRGVEGRGDAARATPRTRAAGSPTPKPSPQSRRLAAHRYRADRPPRASRAVPYMPRRRF